MPPGLDLGEDRGRGASTILEGYDVDATQRNSPALTPRARFDLIDVAASARAQHHDVFTTYRKTLCCSFHTTAGYLDQPFCAALDYSEKRLRQFLLIFQKLFPRMRAISTIVCACALN